MRRLALLIAAVLAVALAGCGTVDRSAPAGPTLHVSVPSSHFVKLGGEGSSATLAWSSFPPWGFSATGYNLYENVGNVAPTTQVGTASQSPYTFTGLTCGTLYTLGVQAHDSSSHSSTISSTPYTTPACPVVPGTTLVGTANAPTPTCTSTVAVNGNVDSALHAAAGGATICLASGTWSNIEIDSSPTTNVTLASATPGGAHVAGITLTAITTNLTIEGLQLSYSIKLQNTMSGINIIDNNMENWGTGTGDAQLDAAVWIYPEDDGTGTPTAHNIAITYNQMDNIPQCEQVSDSLGQPDGMTYSHNVCGPDIGHGEPNDIHYLQMEGETNQVVDNNAFIGPAAVDIGTSHLNILHSCGANLQFDNNIVYNTEAYAQSLLYGDDCSVTGTNHANNNLFVENATRHQFSMWFDNEHTETGMTMSNNTIVNVSDYGGMLAEEPMTAVNNLAAQTGGGSAFSFNGGTQTNNVANDGSGSSTWTPAWQSTSWSPSNGSPWVPPSSTFYKPSGVSSSLGYQGAIGP